MIAQDGWFDWARREPGPPDKKYSEPCLSQGIVFHSAVGYYNGWKSRLFDLSKLPNGQYTDYAAASVTGWIGYDGVLTQHYPISISCWASGNRHANTHFNAFETEGGWNPANEPLREPQIATATRIVKELAALKGWVPNRYDDARDTLLEHNQCVRIWGGASTSCPSNRIPWTEILRRLATPPAPPEEDDMAKLTLIKTAASVFTYATNGIDRWYVQNPRVLKELQDAGLCGTEVETVSEETLKAIRRIG